MCIKTSTVTETEGGQGDQSSREGSRPAGCVLGLSQDLRESLREPTGHVPVPCLNSGHVGAGLARRTRTVVPAQVPSHGPDGSPVPLRGSEEPRPWAVHRGL